MTWYPHAVTIAAASEPVTLAQAKAQCRVDDSASDTEITAYIAAARGHIEAYCGTLLVSRTVAVKCDGFCDFATFPVVPLGSVSAVSYIDTAGATQTLAASVYDVRSDGLTAALALKFNQVWPAIQTGSRITVTTAAGYVAVPEAVRHAMLLLIAQWFDNRAAITVGKDVHELPNAVEALLTNHRAYGY